jgi:hypothetical protein
MADPVKPKTGYEKWQEMIDQAKSDPRWRAYDSEIILAVSEFNAHLSSMKGYFPLDWRLIKAVIWTESGGPDSRAWNSRPMQIGNPGDPGLAALLSGKEGGEIIMPPQLKGRLNMGNAGIPPFNIRAGIAYLLMRCASYGFVQVMDARDSKVYEYTVQAGDSLDKIARRQGTTLEVLRKLNPAAAVVRPGQSIRYQKASIQKIVTRWQPITTGLIAQKYNTNLGDPNYAKKLDYCLSVMTESVGGHHE